MADIKSSRARIRGRHGMIIACLLASATLGGHVAVAAEFAVYKNAGCMCCEKWAEHLRRKGHTVTVNAADDLEQVKHDAHVPGELHSCHTAFVDGYIVEGHVPVADIERMLAERPEAIGLAVPGMPMGSPGMEYNGMKDPYDVILFTADGKMEIFASH